MPVSRLRVLGQAGLLVAGHLALVALFYALLVRPRSGILAGIVVSIALTQSVSIVALCIGLTARRMYRQFLSARSSTLRGPVQQALSNLISDPAARAPALSAGMRHPVVFEECLLEMLPLVRGTARQTLSGLAVQLGMAARWRAALDSRLVRRRRRAARSLALLSPESSLPARPIMLGSTDPEVRLEALRMLARAGEPAGLAAVIDTYGTLNLFQRTLLAEDLRAQAARLCEGPFQAALDNPEAGRLAIALELPATWKRAFHAPSLHALLAHPDAGVRAAALRVLPYEISGRLAADAVLRLLLDPVPAVRAAAAFAAGRFRLRESLPSLCTGLSDQDPEAARSCARALSELGPPGLDALEATIVNADGRAAAFAMEALESARLGTAEATA